jgi:hypothetical protein
MVSMEKQEADGPGAGARPASGFRLVWSFLWKVALAVVLVYGALHVLVRTDFFRSRVEAELSRLAGMEMRVGRIRATESLNLRLRDVISVSEVAGIEARLTRIRWHFFRPKGTPMLESIRLDGLALTIAPDEHGVLQPAFLGALSKKAFAWTGVPLPAAVAAAAEAGGAAEKKAATAPRPGNWSSGPLVFRGVSVRWQDAQGNLQASVSGMDLTWVAMELPNGGRVAHVDCRAAEVKVVDGPRITGLHVELIDAGDQQFLLALEAADWGSAQKPRSAAAEARDLLDAMD